MWLSSTAGSSLDCNLLAIGHLLWWVSGSRFLKLHKDHFHVYSSFCDLRVNRAFFKSLERKTMRVVFSHFLMRADWAFVLHVLLHFKKKIFKENGFWSEQNYHFEWSKTYVLFMKTDFALVPKHYWSDWFCLYLRDILKWLISTISER